MAKTLKEYATQAWVLKLLSNFTPTPSTYIGGGSEGGGTGGIKVDDTLTRAQYEALRAQGKTDPNTLYLICED